MDEDEQIKIKKQSKKRNKKDWIVLGLAGALYFGLIFYIRHEDAKIKRQELVECLKNSSTIEYKKSEYKDSIGGNFNLYEICKNLLDEKELKPYKNRKNLYICIDDLTLINSKASDMLYSRSYEEVKECLKKKEKERSKER
ncbi:MAG: hypothetical protein QXE64_02225 [Candidatus Pacearchaeota archaeon]